METGIADPERTTSEFTPWRKIIRYMSVVAIAMGLTDALYYIWWLSRFKFPRDHRMAQREYIEITLELIPVLLGFALVGGGFLCWDFKRRGHRIVIALTALSTIAPAATQVLRFLQYAVTYHIVQPNIVPVTIQLAQSLVLPAVLWMFFRRHEVLEEMKIE